MSDGGINSSDWIFKKAKDLEAENTALKLQIEQLNRTGVALPALFKIQEACPAAGIASGISVGVEIIVKEYKAALLQLSEAKTLIADWLQHECSVGGPSWEEVENRARAMVAQKPAEQLPVISIRGGGMPLSIENGSKEPFKMPLCDVQVGCFGQCGKLLPCEDHPGKEANYCTCTPGGGGLCAYCRRQDSNMG